MKRIFLAGVTLVLAGLCVLVVNCSQNNSANDWSEYLGGPERNHYSELNQITLDNVVQLQVAWEYHTQDSGQIQCNPLVINGVLYGMTATVQPFALDAPTGKEIWRVRDSTGTISLATSRGVAYWKDGEDERVLYTKEQWLFALDAITGKAILTFGDSGRVSLKSGLGETSKDKFVISNTPGTVYEDLIVMPIRVSEGGC